MKPPIFFMPTSDTPQDYLHRARMYRNAATALPDYVNGEQNWPRYSLLTHATELALKAFVRHSIQNGKPAPAKRPPQHDLRGWYDLALQYGLQDEPTVAAHINVLNELHKDHDARYPRSRPTPLPSADNIADSTVEHLISTITQVINAR